MDEFPGVGKDEMLRMIANARLRACDAQIVRMRLVDKMYFVDIGAEVGCDRRTASRRCSAAIDALRNAK